MLGVDLGYEPDMTAFQKGYRTEMRGIIAWETIGVVQNQRWYPPGCVAIEEEYDDEDRTGQEG